MKTEEEPLHYMQRVTKGVRPVMEQKLNEILLDGEKVRWSGRPVPFKLLELPSRKSILATWIICGGAMVLVLGFLIPFYIRTNRTLLDTVVVLVVTAFLPLMLSFRPVLDKRCLEHDTLYAITNFRAIALVKDDMMFIPLSPKLKTAVAAKDGSCGILCFGEAVDVNPSKQLATAIIGVRTEGSSTPNVHGLMFYHVNDPESLLGYLA